MTDREFLQNISEWLNQPREYHVIPEREKLLFSIITSLQKLLERENIHAKIEVERPALPLGSAIINIEAEQIIIKDIPQFCSVISNLQNFEVLPLPNGKLQFAAVFPDFQKITLSNE